MADPHPDTDTGDGSETPDQGATPSTPGGLTALAVIVVIVVVVLIVVVHATGIMGPGVHS